MFKAIAAVILLVVVAIFGATSCTRVAPGEVGVRVNNWGSNAGVEATPLGIGRYSELFGVDIYTFPTTVKTENYEQVSKDDKGDEIPFQDKNGLIVTSDVTISYHIDPSKAPQLFQLYKLDTDNLIAGPVRNKVRAALVTAASTMTVEDIYGSGKARLIAEATKLVRAYFEPRGLIVDGLDWAGPIRIPENIVERINARAQTEQARVAADAQVATEQAKGKALVATAEAKAQAALITAKGLADATRAKNEAVAQSPGYQNEWVRKWDGQLPKVVYCSSANPCVAVQQ